MDTLSAGVTDDAVSSLLKLREMLMKQLAKVEDLQQHSQRSTQGELIEYEGPSAFEINQARTSVLSGLASIEETLSWVRFLAVKDSKGDELECVRTLPDLSIPIQN